MFRVILKYNEPFRISAGQTISSQNVICKISTDNKLEGWGESCPSQRVTGESFDTVVSAIEKIAPHLIGLSPIRIEKAVSMMDEAVTASPSAKAAIDIALHDILGKVAGLPLYLILGGYRKTVLTDITLSIKSPEEMAKDAIKAVKRGFKALKLKVGVNPAIDITRIAAVRKAIGDNIALRVDANQGWTTEQAIKILNRIEKFKIQFAEQPIPAENLNGLVKIRQNSPIPIMADESVHSPEDSLRLIQAEAVDLINIKLMKCGGILKAKRISQIAETAGLGCMVGCMGESRIGITGATHLAAATKNIKYADLDSDLSLKSNLVKEGGAMLKNSERTLFDYPGLGIKKLNKKLLGKPVKKFGESIER